ncbi:hypothetical protein ACLOJK_039529 [Asimina triloba]
MAAVASALSSILSTNASASSRWASKSLNLAAVPFVSVRTLATTRYATRWWKNRRAEVPVCRSSQQEIGREISSSPTTKQEIGCRVAEISIPPANNYPEYNRLLPCPSDSGPPRVEHLVVSEGGAVRDCICRTLDLPPLYVADLIHFGAVYYALVCPEPPPTATPEQIRVFKEVTSPSVLKKRASIKGKTVREAQKTFRITHVDEYVEEGTYLRIYVHPKRFPKCYEIDWKSRIIAITESYVVLDKPAGTSVGGTTNNIEESCATFASRALGLETPLKTTHQIDNCSEGCVVFAKTKEYCSVFHGKIREKQVKKLYLALAASPVSVGTITHYMRPANLAPKIFGQPVAASLLAAANSGLRSAAGYWIARRFPGRVLRLKKNTALKIVRAQLAACGAPIVGDSMYMPAVLAEIANPNLNPFGNSKGLFIDTNDRTRAIQEWIACHGKEPAIAIGLQAHQISWDDGKCFYEAGAPWWKG